jgi:hypothetical protein
VVEKLLSLITFFAAAKKVIPPPGRRLLNKQQDNSSALHEEIQPGHEGPSAAKEKAKKQRPTPRAVQTAH